MRAFLFATLLGGCLQTPKVRRASDAGPDDAGTGLEPRAPAAPVLTPCPEGWREVVDPDDADVVVCDPWPEGGALDCGADEAHFPGESVCARIGPACPAGDFAEDLPGDVPVVYVLSGAPAGGDGSLASPFATIVAAVAAAADGAWIAISKGTFTESVALDRPVTLRGACVSETLVAPSATTPALVVQGAGGVSIQNLTLRGNQGGIVVLDPTDPVELGSIVVDASREIGIAMFGGAVVARDLVVRETRTDAAGEFGYGIQVSEGATLDLDRALVQGGAAAGIAVIDAGSTLTAADLAVLDVGEGAPDGMLGLGIDVAESAEATLSRVVVERSWYSGLGIGGRFVAEDLVVRDVGVEDPESIGTGGFTSATASLELRRASFDGARSVAFNFEGTEGDALLEDVVVRDTRTSPTDGLGGYGVASTGPLELRRIALLRNRAVGLIVGDGGSITGSDVRIASTLERADLHGSHAIEAYGGSQMALDAVAIRESQEVGIVSYGATLTFVDLTIDDTTGFAGAGGAGICSAEASSVDVTSFRISTSALVGVQVTSQGTLDLHHGEVSHNSIGANVQVPGFDIGRLQDDVAYVDNDATLDGSALPIPEPFGGI